MDEMKKQLDPKLHTEKSMSIQIKSASTTPDAVRRLYRTCVECVRKLDQTTKDGKSLTGLFSPETIAFRNKLRESGEQLMLMNPVEYGRRAEELIWRKCFYEPISLLRQNKEVLTDAEHGWTMMLISNGIGYYQGYITRLQQNGLLKVNHNVLSNGFAHLKWNCYEKSKVSQYGKEKWAVKSAVRVLVYMGDLARYQTEFDEYCLETLAQKYYSLAISLKPDAGIPYNQLGTLFTSRNYGCDSIFFYLRCILASEGFEGAQGNLMQILKKNLKLSSAACPQNVVSKKECLKQLINEFLQLTRFFYDDDAECNIGDHVNMMLQYFGICLLWLSNSACSDVENRNEFSVTLLVRTIGIQLMLVKKLQDKGSFKLTAAIALALAMLLKLLENTLMRLKRTLPAMDEEKSVDNNSGDISDNQGSGDQGKHTATNGTTRSKLLPHMRRRRKRRQDIANGNDSSSNSGSESDSEKDADDVCSEDDVLSEAAEDQTEFSDVNSSEIDDLEDKEDYNNVPGEETGSGATGISLAEAAARLPGVISSMQCPASKLKASESAALSAGTSQISSPLTVGDDYAKLLSGLKTQTHHTNGSATTVEPNSQQSVEFKCQVLQQQLQEISELGGLLAIKVIFDWLRCNPNLIVSVGESSHALWTHLVELLNLLPKDEETVHYVSKDPSLHRSLQGIVWAPVNDWQQKVPLMEDIAVRSLPPLAQVHNTLDFNSETNHGPFVEGIVRMFSLRSFGHFLVRLNVPGLKYDRGRQLFIFNTGQVTVQELPDVADLEAKREALLKNMAVLRLQDEMEQLQSKGWIPVYLVPDSAALSNCLSALKQLVVAQKFVVVIPRSVIEELDALKKVSGSAREATRYLENEFRRGSRYIRMHKKLETVDEPELIMESPKKETKGILSCCTELRSTVESPRTPSVIVTVVSGNLTTSPDFQALSDALDKVQLNGITLENIHQFNKKWQNYRKKDG